MIRTHVKFWSLLTALTVFFGVKAAAQSVLTPRTIGMGGGGTAYLSGYSSNFLNPANLLIPEYKFNNSAGLGQAALFLDKQPIKSTIHPYNFLYDQFTPQKLTNVTLTPSEHKKIIADWFPGDNNTYSRTARFDAVLFGLNWQNGTRSYSIALRTRGINRMTIDRGWYDSNFQKINNKQVLKRDLSQTIAVYHELSFGFAEQVSLINGWTSRLNRLYIGIAPKLVFGGMYFRGNYQSSYFIGSNSSYQNVRSFNGISTGSLSNVIGKYNAKAGAYSFPPNSLSYHDALNPTGIGAGLDMGFTYVISLGNDTALLHRKKTQALKKSFRLSASLTDIGFVRYNKNIVSYHAPNDTIPMNNIPNSSNKDFIGSPGSFSRFVASDDPNGLTYRANNESHPKKHDTPLPAAFHVGSVLQLNWWLASVDFTYALNSNTFNSKYLVTNLGGELRLIPFLPIRLGVQLQQTHDPIFGLGTALNLSHFELSTGIQINTPGVQHNTYILSTAITAVKVRF